MYKKNRRLGHFIKLKRDTEPYFVEIKQRFHFLISYQLQELKYPTIQIYDDNERRSLEKHNNILGSNIYFIDIRHICKHFLFVFVLYFIGFTDSSGNCFCL